MQLLLLTIRKVKIREEKSGFPDSSCRLRGPRQVRAGLPICPPACLRAANSTPCLGSARAEVLFLLTVTTAQLFFLPLAQFLPIFAIDEGEATMDLNRFT